MFVSIASLQEDVKRLKIKLLLIVCSYCIWHYVYSVYPYSSIFMLISCWNTPCVVLFTIYVT